METGLSRRAMLKGSGLLGLGAAAVAVVDSSASSAAETTDQPAQGPVTKGFSGPSQLAVVRDQAGDSVTVDVVAAGSNQIAQTVVVRAIGFPDGWQFTAGDQVLLTQDGFNDEPAAARPLVNRVVGTSAQQLPSGGEQQWSVGSDSLRLRRETLRTRGGNGTADRYEAYCIPNVSQADPSCVAVRPVG